MVRSKTKKVLLVVGFVVLFTQLLFFYENIFGYRPGQILVEGLACTCPDARVIENQNVLEAKTPDSLKVFRLDYSEVYVTPSLSTKPDFIGVGTYWIKGDVVSKQQISENDLWNPLISVTSMSEFDPALDASVRIFFISQVIVLFFLAFMQARRWEKS